MTVLQKFMKTDIAPLRTEYVDSGCFSTCYNNTATTVIVANKGLHYAFVKLLTGIVLNKYFMKHYGKPYMLGIKSTRERYYFLVRRLDTNYKEYISSRELETYFHNHELGTMYKANFYPYISEYKQENINEIWLDAKMDNCGYYKGALILFDAIPYCDNPDNISHEVFEQLCNEYNIPYKKG